MTYREDLVANYKKGKRYGTLDVLGFNIDADAFLGDAVQNDFSDLSNSLIDAEQIRAPTFICVSEKDSWVRTEDARAVFKAVGSNKKQIVTMPLVLHRFIENRSAMKYALRHSVHFSIGTTLNRGSGVNEVRILFSGKYTPASFMKNQY